MQVLDLLSKMDNASLEFRTGSLILQFTRGLGVWSGRQDVIQLSIEVEKEDAGEIVAYEYELKEIQRLAFGETEAFVKAASAYT